MNTAEEPTKEQIRRWRRYLADEIAEGEIYRTLAERREGEEREILLELSAAEKRHEDHWRQLLGPHAKNPPRPSFHRTLLRFFARIFGSVFVLALLQRSESDTPYSQDVDATDEMAADEAIHGEVVRGLAARGREKIAGNFRAAVFGANDGIVSNFALVLGIAATNVPVEVVIFTGITGLLAGALSMAAGEYISVRSQREFVEASSPDEVSLNLAKHLDVNANELELVYLARGMEEDEARRLALQRLGYLKLDPEQQERAREADETGAIPIVKGDEDDYAEFGSAWGAAGSSFIFFGSGALIPILPFLFGASGIVGTIWASILCSIALLITGGMVGLMSAKSPFTRAIRQLLIGLGAAAVTYFIGSLITF